LALALAFMATLMPAAARSVLAADEPAFGAPAIAFTFLSEVTLTESVTVPSGVTAVEALVTTEGSDRVLVAPVQVPSSPTTILRYSLPAGSGELLPNTRVEMGFRVTLADGRRFAGPTASTRYLDTRYDWQTLSGAIVTVHWTDGGRSFGKRALDIAEKAIADASELLGVTEKDPIDFYVYADRNAFYDVLGPGSRENVGGVAEPEIRTLFANIDAGAVDDPWVGVVIPHELTHLVFDTATKNPYHTPTHWLNEGLAVYLSEGYGSAHRRSVESAVRDGSLMPVTALGGQFPTSVERFGLAYDESVSAIDFLVRQYGRDALVRLVKTYAAGVTDDEAFRAGTGIDVAAFQDAWLASLGVAAPSPFGPQPAPTGPVPSDWAGAGVTSGVASPAGSPSASGPPAAGDAGASGISTAIGLVVLGGVVLGLVIVLSRRRARPAA